MPDRKEVRFFLNRKLAACCTREGRSIVNEAIDLQPHYPDLDGGELIRLAYWGASGSSNRSTPNGQ